jgi:ribonuclease I
MSTWRTTDGDMLDAVCRAHYGTEAQVPAVLAANPGLAKEAVSVTCAGRFLNEIRVCLGKDMKGRACSADVTRQACRVAEIIVQPVR